MTHVLALLLALAPPARAERAPSGTLRLALVEDNHPHVSMVLNDAVERVLHESSATAKLVSVRTLPCYYSGSDYRLRLPDSGIEGSTPGAAVETPSETALVYPPEPAFLERFRAAAEDVGTYQRPWSVRFSSRAVTLRETIGRDGEAVVTAFLKPEEGESARWHSTIADVYQLRWQGTDVTVALIGKAFGSLARQAAAVEREKARGPVVGVARGGTFGDVFSELPGRKLAEALEEMGLQYAAVGGSELRHWDELSAYRRDRPKGIVFLSVNLAYSTAPAATVFQDHALVEAGGLRVAIVGVTPPGAAKYLPAAGLSWATVIDPLEAVEARVPALRREADAVVLLAPSEADLERLRHSARGVDLVLAADAEYPVGADGPDLDASQQGRAPFQPPLHCATAYRDSLNIVEAEVKGGSDWKVHERHVLLGDSVGGAPGFPEFDPLGYGITFSTAPALIPSARRVFTQARAAYHPPQVGARDFWTMAASLAARETRSEAAVLRVLPLPATVDDEIREDLVKAWLRVGESAVIARVKGSELKALIAEAREQVRREGLGLPPGDKPRLAVGGLGLRDSVHGLPIEDQQEYRIAVTRVLVDALGLSAARDTGLAPLPLDELVLSALRKKAGSPPEAYRDWMQGLPVGDEGFWKVNFRDVGLNLQNTSVARDDAFDAVPNSRIQGFNELLVGGVLKTDAEYLKGRYRWTDTLELEYSKSRLRPRHAPPVTNTTANRAMFLTRGTRRQGAIAAEWLARSWGPSLGVQYDGELEANPGLKRKQSYSAFPGLEFYDGTFIRSLELSGNVKRDLSRDPPNTQYGFHARTLFSRAVGPQKGAKLQGEVYANYFFLTREDTAQDLRFEGDANFKLQVLIRKHLTIAPFVDFYAFALKTRPLWGYSAMTGISIGFSRLWKPQYERF